MKFQVNIFELNYGATKASKATYYTEGNSISEAIENAKVLSKKYHPHATITDVESAYRTDGPGFHWVALKYIVGVEPSNK